MSNPTKVFILWVIEYDGGANPTYLVDIYANSHDADDACLKKNDSLGPDSRDEYYVSENNIIGSV